jgi:hypothetical protein
MLYAAESDVGLKHGLRALTECYNSHTEWLQTLVFWSFQPNSLRFT